MKRLLKQSRPRGMPLPPLLLSLLAPSLLPPLARLTPRPSTSPPLSTQQLAPARSPPISLLATPLDAPFSDLPWLPARVQSVLAEQGISRPTPIQTASLHRLLEGESLLLHAETGSGKSLAFLLPVLMRLGVLDDAAKAAGAELQGDTTKVLIIAPTRELSVQIANVAATLLGVPNAVQIVAVGVSPTPLALFKARVVCGTAEEMMAMHDQDGDNTGVMESVLQNTRALVIDELDTVLPVSSTYGPRAKERKKKEMKKVPPSVAETLVRSVLEACSAPDLQVIAASATVSRPSRLKLERVLRRDPLGRFFDASLAVVRPAHVDEQVSHT